MRVISSVKDEIAEDPGYRCCYCSIFRHGRQVLREHVDLVSIFHCHCVEL